MRRLAPVLLLVLASSAASAQVLNGSFENLPMAAPDRISINNATDWTAQGGFMLLERGVNGVSGIAAHSGSQFVSMGHNGAQGDTLFQDISTVPGATYTLSFFLHCIQGSEAQTLAASALSSGVVLGSLDAIVSSPTQGWVGFNLEFQATQPQTQIRFVHTVGSGVANIALDSVSVVPTPGAMALMGLGGALALRRRR